MRNDLYRVLMAEALKLRRTLAVRLTIFAPIMIVLIVFATYAERRDITGISGVLTGFAQLILTMWTIIIFPLYGALVAALLASIEHQK